MEPQDAKQGELSGAADVAERASSIVTDHVRSIIDSAQARAADVTREAESDARELRAEAHQAATQVLERIDSLEDTLGSALAGLRDESASVSETLKDRS